MKIDIEISLSNVEQKLVQLTIDGDYQFEWFTPAHVLTVKLHHPTRSSSRKKGISLPHGWGVSQRRIPGRCNLT
jgi:hypothetical protein